MDKTIDVNYFMVKETEVSELATCLLSVEITLIDDESSFKLFLA